MDATENKCTPHGKDYEFMGEFLWVLLDDGMLSRAEAKREYQDALEGLLKHASSMRS